MKFVNESTVEIYKSNAADIDVARAAWVSQDEAAHTKEREDGRVAGLIDFLWRNGHSCYDDETEVLTRQGWKKWPDVTEDDEFLSVNLDTEESRYEKASELHAYDYDDDLIRIEHGGADLMVTPNHNLVVSTRTHTHDGPQVWTPYRLERADVATERGFKMPKALGSINQPGVGLSAAEAEFLGFMAGDGHIPTKRYGSPQVHLHKERKVDYLHGLVSQLEPIGLTEGACGRFTITGVPTNLRTLLNDTYHSDGTRQVPEAIRMNASAEEATAFIKGYLTADGHDVVDREGSWSFTAVGTHMIDGISQLAASVGKAVTVTSPMAISTAYKSRHTHINTARLTSPRNSSPRIGPTVEQRQKQVSRQHYQGKVYCATVPNGTLYVRRNGKPVWSGNSPFEHGQFTFIVHTPLFVAREFMRHRTFSFNEVSGRYTELEPEFYVPPKERPLQQKGKVGNYTFEAGDERQRHNTRAYLETASESAWEDYQELLENGIAKEVARMVLPVNIMTTFWATVNPLNLMKFLNLRAAPDALYEIREVAYEMERHFSDVMPLTWATWRATK